MRTFLILFSVLALLAGCAPSSTTDEDDAALDARERFFVEQYLRVVEARALAIEGSDEADSLYAVLAAEIPLDSITNLADRISRKRPERWRPIFREIERRLDQP